MIDLGLGSVFKHLQRHLGLLAANIFAGCIFGIALCFLILVLIQVLLAVESLILSAIPYRIALGIIIATAVVAGAAAIPYMMKAHYFRYAIKNADEQLQRQYKEHHGKMKKDHDEFFENAEKLLVQMKDYNDKLEAYKKDTYG